MVYFDGAVSAPYQCLRSMPACSKRKKLLHGTGNGQWEGGGEKGGSPKLRVLVRT